MNTPTDVTVKIRRLEPDASGVWIAYTRTGAMEVWDMEQRTITFIPGESDKRDEERDGLPRPITSNDAYPRVDARGVKVIEQADDWLTAKLREDARFEQAQARVRQRNAEARRQRRAKPKTDLTAMKESRVRESREWGDIGLP